jgi:hypothetical protein
MSKICEVIQHSLKMGYLTQEAEEELRQLLQNTKYGVSELNAFAQLQHAAMQGQVRQQSRENLESTYPELKI